MHGGWWAYLSYDDKAPKPPLDRDLIRRALAWAKPYTWQVVVGLALLLAISLIELIPPLLFGDLVRALTDGTLTMSRLNMLALGMLGVPILSSLLAVVQRGLSARVGEGIIYDLRVAMYTHMQRMSLRFFTETKTGDIISRFSNDVVGAQNAVTNTLPNLVTNVLTVATTLAVMIRLDWRLTLVSVAALPLFLLPTKRVGKTLRSIRREGAGYDAAMSTRVQETMNVSGALLVRTYGRMPEEIDRFEGSARAVRDIGVRRAVVGRLFFFGLGIATAIGTALMYWAGGYLALTGGLVDAGMIVTFAAYVGRLYGPISALSNLQVEFATSLVSFERVFEYLDIPVEIASPEHPEEPGEVRGAIALSGVWFAYEPRAAAAPNAGPNAAGDGFSVSGATAAAVNPPPAAPPPPANPPPSGEPDWTLRNVDFAVAPGTVAALVGPSGAGKTTIGYLVARLYDPTLGSVTLDGHDLRRLDLALIQRHVGVVSQEAFLFHDTIRHNLAFARPDATQEQIDAACAAANFAPVVAGLPDGYDTIVGERGYRLSGGEKQRLAIARVILKDPSVLVLDEATSHLDSQSEALVQEALERVMRGRTSLVIAHRLSTVVNADQVLVVVAGEVVERGRHAQLLKQGGVYAELFRTQFQVGRPVDLDVLAAVDAPALQEPEPGT